jgi:hypothetical protein
MTKPAPSMTPEQMVKSDMQTLLRQPAFLRFLWTVIQTSGVLQPTTDGPDGRNLRSEGRRNLGLEILAMAEKGQPIQSAHPDGPLLTLIQVLREETQKQPEETQRDRQDRYDELRDGDEPDDDQADTA